jgi:MFS family permease
VFVASRLRPLRAPAFRRYFAGTATSNLGNAFTAVALAFAVLEATGSVAAVGLVLAATRLPLLLFLVAGGVVGDRLPRRVVMLTCDGVRAVVQAGAALLLAVGCATLWELLVLFAVHGLAQAFFQPASARLLPQIVGVEERQEANALLELSRGAIGLAGMLVGGVVVATVGPAAALGIDSLTFAVSAAALAGLAVDGAMPAHSGSLARTCARAGMSSSGGAGCGSASCTSRSSTPSPWWRSSPSGRSWRTSRSAGRRPGA